MSAMKFLSSSVRSIFGTTPPKLLDTNINALKTVILLLLLLLFLNNINKQKIIAAMQSFRFRAGQFVVKCEGRLDYQALLGK